MTWPAHLWGAPRVVDGTRDKCWRPDCITRCGSKYSGRYVCERHAREQMVIEQRSARQAVAR